MGRSATALCRATPGPSLRLPNQNFTRAGDLPSGPGNPMADTTIEEETLDDAPPPLEYFEPLPQRPQPLPSRRPSPMEVAAALPPPQPPPQRTPSLPPLHPSSSTLMRSTPFSGLGTPLHRLDSDFDPNFLRLPTAPSSMAGQSLFLPPPPPPPSSRGNEASRGTLGSRSRSSSPHVGRSTVIRLGECVVCPSALPEKAPKLPKAARALLPTGLPDLFVCSRTCASYLQGNHLTGSPTGRQAMDHLQRWATEMCRTPLRVDDVVDVFDNTLPGFNVSASDFPDGGRISGVHYTGNEPPLQCEIRVRPPIGGASVKVLPSGVRMRSNVNDSNAHSNAGRAMAMRSSITVPPSDVEQLAMQHDSMAQRLAASTALQNKVKKQKIAAEMKASSLEAKTSSLEVDLDIARSRQNHYLSSDNEQGARWLLCVVARCCP